MPLLTPAKILALKVIGVVTLIAVATAVMVYKGPGFSWSGMDFSLSPARDLRGTWVSSLSGKGFNLVGHFVAGGATTTITETGDIELIIEKVEGDKAYGTINMKNVCASGKSIVPLAGTINVPQTCFTDTGPTPVEMKISSSSIDFGTITSGEVTATMKGSFTTDLMSGNMSVLMAGYGQVNGTFKLMRKSK